RPDPPEGPLQTSATPPQRAPAGCSRACGSRATRTSATPWRALRSPRPLLQPVAGHPRRARRMAADRGQRPGIDSGDRSPGGGATRAPRGLGSLLQGAAFRGNKTTGAEVRFREPLVLVQRRDLLPLHDPAVRAAEDPGDRLRAYDLRRAG